MFALKSFVSFSFACNLSLSRVSFTKLLMVFLQQRYISIILYFISSYLCKHDTQSSFTSSVQSQLLLYHPTKHYLPFIDLHILHYHIRLSPVGLLFLAYPEPDFLIDSLRSDLTSILYPFKLSKWVLTNVSTS